jgi:hypothetical protein
VSRALIRSLAAGMLGGLLAVSAQAQEGQPCPRPGTQQDLPQTLGPGFERGPTFGFEASMPGGGCSVRYKHPSGMWADVYIYQAKLGHIEDVARDPRLLREFQSAMGGITHSWQQRYANTKVRDVVANYEEHGQSRTEVMVGWALIDRPDMELLRTYVQLWSGGGSIWKLRTTFPAADKAVSDAAVQGLGDALVDLSREKP